MSYFTTSDGISVRTGPALTCLWLSSLKLSADNRVRRLEVLAGAVTGLTGAFSGDFSISTVSSARLNDAVRSCKRVNFRVLRFLLLSWLAGNLTGVSVFKVTAMLDDAFDVRSGDVKSLWSTSLSIISVSDAGGIFSRSSFSMVSLNVIDFRFRIDFVGEISNSRNIERRFCFAAVRTGEAVICLR